jgi:hypothetical protein
MKRLIAVNYSPFNNYPVGYDKSYRQGSRQQLLEPVFPTTTDWIKVFLPNAWYLFPAAVGILGASVLGFSLNVHPTNSIDDSTSAGSNTTGSSSGTHNSSNLANPNSIGDGSPMFLPNVYTFIATGGISLYIVETLFSVRGRFWLTISTIIVGTLTAVLLYASMYFYVYRLDPTTFSRKYIGDNIADQYYSFIYFSATTITVGSFGDILPLTTGSRTMVIMEVLFFLFILTNGVAAISQAKRR